MGAALKQRAQRPMNVVIQVARQQLGLDDETYRDLLASVVPGKTSTRDMTEQELWRVVEVLKEKGFQVVARPGDASMCDEEQARLVRHKWLLLKQYGILRDPSERALLRYVKRIAKVDRMEWAKPKAMNTLVETIKRWVDRAETDLLQKAVASGAVSLPYFCDSFGVAEVFLRCGPRERGLSQEAKDALREYRHACEAFLATYKAPKQAAAKGDLHEERRRA